MKLYKSIDEIPFINWVNLHKGYKNGVPDVKQLIKKMYFPLRKKHLKELFQTFDNIINSLPESDTHLVDLWADYLFEYKKYLQLQNINRAAKLAEYPEQNIDLLPMNKAFDTYINYLDDNNKDFELFVYHIIDDYKEKWHYKEEIPKELIDNDKYEFVIFEEFINKIKEWDFFIKLILKEELQEFIEKYITVKVHKFGSIKFINDNLYKMFRDDLKDMAKYRKIRRHFFDYQKLSFEPIEEFDILKDLLDLAEVNNLGYINYKDKSFTLGDYYRLRNRAKEKAKEAERINKKRDGKV